MLVNITSYDSSAEAVCFNQFSIYIGGAGGFGGKKRSEYSKPLVTMPTRAPDASVREKTDVSVAAIYRLSGDLNPIHIDPDFAQLGGGVKVSFILCFFHIEYAVLKKKSIVKLMKNSSLATCIAPESNLKVSITFSIRCC